jgi:hypothetical protein
MTELIKLYHGTTWTRAMRIVEEGWQPQDVHGIVKDVATQFGTEASALLQDIRTYGGYMVADQGRGGHVSFTGSRPNATWTWAQIAPEARREALWAVWRTLHAPDEESRVSWSNDPQGRQWVLEQLSDDKPALLTVSLTREEWGEALLAGSAEQMLSVSSELLEMFPEFKVRQPFRPRADAVAIEELPRIVEWKIFAKMLGLSQDAFVERAKAGEFGVPGHEVTPTGYPFEKAWWPLDAVESMLVEGRP